MDKEEVTLGSIISTLEEARSEKFDNSGMHTNYEALSNEVLEELHQLEEQIKEKMETERESFGDTFLSRFCKKILGEK